MAYYKERNMKFRLKNLETTPQFTIWKAWDKRGEEYKDTSGNVMKFPIKDGMLTNDKGDIKDVSDIRFMPNKDFKEQYSRYVRRFQFLRQIYVGDVEYTFRFTSTANQKLKEKIEDLNKTGKDALRTEFEQTYDSAKTPADKYNIKLSQVDLPAVQPKEVITTGVNVVSREQQIIEAIISVHGKNCEEARFIDIMKKNGVDENKSKELYIGYKR